MHDRRTTGERMYLHHRAQTGQVRRLEGSFWRRPIRRSHISRLASGGRTKSECAHAKQTSKGYETVEGGGGKFE